MKRRRVLIIGHSYTAPVNRLKWDYVAEDPRFEILLVTPKKWQNYLTFTNNVSPLKTGGYRTLFVGARLGPWFGWHHVLYLIPRLRAIIRNFQPDLIYCEQEPICLVSGQTALLSRGIPVVFFSWENIRRRDLKYRLLVPIRTLCYRKAIFMAAGSPGVAKVIRFHGYRKPIYISPQLGVSEELFFPALESNDQNPNKPFVIGFLGRFVEQKGVDTLLQAVVSMNPKIPWRLVLVGEGPLHQVYKDLMQREGLSNRVEFHKAVPHEKVPAFLHRLDVLALPSRSTSTWQEQFGHVLIEAMACGVPPVGSSSGQIPKTIGDAGLVFQEGEVRDLQKKLETLYENAELRQELQRRGLARVKEFFTDRRIAANAIAIFEKALNFEPLAPNTLQIDICN
jgi:glycosyltransferase involved in cell wall biosynthesis